ncbi:hypothetical protein M8J76_011029 [Diaphorina citri]|nr:hypothetical protein M8J75_010188 [Diaphorina citri]KAI5730191.1 hypothetical protein M8J76_011029 [Diaphorina citri]KAI5734619.1 hypothetical protein M8J77_008807 [Diaphorina citri]
MIRVERLINIDNAYYHNPQFLSRHISTRYPFTISKLMVPSNQNTRSDPNPATNVRKSKSVPGLVGSTGTSASPGAGNGLRSNLI